MRKLRLKNRLTKYALIICITILAIILIKTFATAYQHSRYDRQEFNCVQMSEESRGWFELLGLETRRAVGHWRSNESRSHQWVTVKMFNETYHFEPIDLEFFDPYKKYNDVYIGEWQ